MLFSIHAHSLENKNEEIFELGKTKQDFADWCEKIIKSKSILLNV